MRQSSGLHLLCSTTAAYPKAPYSDWIRRIEDDFFFLAAGHGFAQTYVARVHGGTSIKERTRSSERRQSAQTQSHTEGLTHLTPHTTGQSKIARRVIIGQNRFWIRLGLGGRGSRLPLWPIASGEGRSAPPASPRPGPHIAHAAPSTGSRYSLPIPRQALVADDEDGCNVYASRHRTSAPVAFHVLPRKEARIRGWRDAAAPRGVVLSRGVGAPR